jgi:pyruvate formate lyase activating enzyme
MARIGKNQGRSGEEGMVFKISRCSAEDGPGLRTVVFLKGCPLKCIWCHSPQSQKFEPEMAFIENRCIRCGACAANCSRQAQVVSKTERYVNWLRCNQCGECEPVCPSRAIETIGQYLKIEEIIRTIKKDSAYYKNSGGGVTFSGGEPTLQPDFLRECLKICSEAGIHTAVETCGYARWAVLEEIIPFVDLFLYDIKHTDSTRHRELTGTGNELILENLGKISRNGKAIWIRAPLITGYNDSSDNIGRMADLVSRLKTVQLVSLLPYNTAAGANYTATGREYSLTQLGLYSREKGQELTDIFVKMGIKAIFNR